MVYTQPGGGYLSIMQDCRVHWKSAAANAAHAANAAWRSLQGYADAAWREFPGNELPLLMLGLALLAACCPTPFGIFALALQLQIQSFVVYRSTCSEQQRRRRKRDVLRLHNPALNVLRSVAGTIVVAAVDVGVSVRLADRPFPLKLAWHVFASYWIVALSEYMVHRFIWHAHWTRHRGVPRLFSHLQFHYIHHYLAHHDHAGDPATRARMERGQDDPLDAERKRAIKTRETRTGDGATRRFVAYSLACSNHGFTIGTVECRVSTASLYLLCPSGFAFLAHAVRGDELGAAAHALSTVLPLWMAIEHRAFHAGREALLRWAKGRRTWIERMFWSSEAMARKVEEHQMHHYATREHGEIAFCGALPFGHLVVFPMWQTW